MPWIRHAFIKSQPHIIKPTPSSLTANDCSRFLLVVIQPTGRARLSVVKVDHDGIRKSHILRVEQIQEWFISGRSHEPRLKIERLELLVRTSYLQMNKELHES